MHLRHLAVAVAAFSATTAFAADRNFDRTLNVSGPATLNVSTGSGYIHLYSGSGNQVHIVGHVHARAGMFGFSDAEADRTVDQIAGEPPINQSGNTITIRPPHDSDLYRHVSIDYDITVPASSTASANTGSGQIEIGGIQGEVTAGTGSGSIHVDNIGGNTHLQTGSGGINATNVHGAASAQTGSGHIHLDVTAPGEVRARTGSGGMDLAGIQGGLRADSGSGSVNVTGNPSGEWDIHTGSGGVNLKVPPDAHFNLDAHTGSGGIHTDRPVTIQSSASSHHMSGTVNGGGPTVRVQTGSGGVNIR